MFFGATSNPQLTACALPAAPGFYAHKTNRQKYLRLQLRAVFSLLTRLDKLSTQGRYVVKPKKVDQMPKNGWQFENETWNIAPAR